MRKINFENVEKKKISYSVSSFINENKFLSLLFLISIIIMIKNSSIPFITNNPYITDCCFVKFLFLKPESDTGKGLLDMIEVFASSYVTGLIFYYLVEFIPAKDREEKAKKLILPRVYLICSRIEYLLLFFKSCEKSMCIEKLDSIDCPPELMDNPCYAVRITNFFYKDNSTNMVTKEKITVMRQYAALIKKTCVELNNLVVFSRVDDEIIDLINQFYFSDFINSLCDFTFKKIKF